MVLEHEEPTRSGNDRSQQMTMPMAHYGHCRTCFCVVWYGAAGISRHPLYGTLVADVTLFRQNKSPKIHQQRTTNPVDCAPSIFLRSVLPSRPQPAALSVPAGWQNRSHKPLCGALWHKAGTTAFVEDPHKPSATLAHSCRYHVGPCLPSCGSELCSSETKSGVVPVLVHLPLSTSCRHRKFLRR